MRSSPSKQAHEAVPADRSICTLKLSQAAIRSVFPEVSMSVRGPGGQVTAAVRRLLGDLASLFGLPAPMRALLEADRDAHGIATNTQYIQWLVLQRASSLATAAAENADRSST